MKCPTQPFTVTSYRGSTTHYLHKIPDKYYVLNTFTSTSTDIHTAISFSKVSKKRNSSVVYQFIIQSGTPSIYIGPPEDELLINPYQMYTYLGEKEINGIQVLQYYIKPYSKQIPDTYDEFMEFKAKILYQPQIKTGGKMSNIVHNKHSISYKYTLKHTKNKKEKTRKNKKMTPFQQRMQQPIIGTLIVGLVPTEEEKKLFDEIRKREGLKW